MRARRAETPARPREGIGTGREPWRDGVSAQLGCV